MSTTTHILAAPDLQRLLDLLQQRGYRVIGPTVDQDVIIYDTIERTSQLPKGLRDEQSPGRYRLTPRDDGAWFGHAVGPHAWKRWLHPPVRTLWSAKRNPETGQLEVAHDGARRRSWRFWGSAPVI